MAITPASPPPPPYPSGNTYREVLAYVKHSLEKERRYYRLLIIIGAIGILWWTCLFCAARNADDSNKKRKTGSNPVPKHTGFIGRLEDITGRELVIKPSMLYEVPGLIWPILVSGFAGLELVNRRKRLHALMEPKFRTDGGAKEEAALREQMSLTLWEHFTNSEDSNWDSIKEFFKK